MKGLRIPLLIFLIPGFAAICVTAYWDFLYYNELASLRCFEVFATLLLAFTYLRAKQTFIVLAPMFCWQNLTLRLAVFTYLYIRCRNFRLAFVFALFFSLLAFLLSYFFVQFAFQGYESYQNKGNSLTSVCGTGVSYLFKHLFGLHWLRAGGAPAAANVGVSD